MVLILIAGYPATGKTYLAQLIMSRYPDAFVDVDYDGIKEEYWDTFGFDTLAEKEALNARALQEFYRRLETAMGAGRQILSDYPFSYKQRGTLESLASKYGYRILTIRMVGDLRSIFSRSRRRDLSQSRHLGHLVSRYHKGDVLQDRTQADQLVDFETLATRCEDRGYGSFSLGRTIEVNATYVGSIDYMWLLDQIDACMKGDAKGTQGSVQKGEGQ